MVWLEAHWLALIGPVVVAAVISGIIAVIGLVVSTKTARTIHSDKLEFDERLAERKFDFDKELAERKFTYDRDLHDHKRRVEMAEAVLADFLQMADVVRAIRSPASSRTEAAGRQRPENESEDMARDRDTYFVPLARIRENSEFISGLMSKKYRSKAVLGDEIDEAFAAVHEVIIRIQVSASTLSNMVGRGRAAFERNEGLWSRCEADIWAGAPGDDQIQPMIERSIAVAESVCRPILEKGQPT